MDPISHLTGLRSLVKVVFGEASQEASGCWNFGLGVFHSFAFWVTEKYSAAPYMRIELIS